MFFVQWQKRVRHLLSLASFCAAATAALIAQNGASITVHVNDAVSEQPVIQAQVRLYPDGQPTDSHRTFTDATGFAQFPGLSRGTYYLEVVARGYISSRERIDLPAGTAQNFEVRLQPEKQDKPQAEVSLPTSAADLAVPKEARKYFEEGVKKVDKDLDAGAKLFQLAIEKYPKFGRAHAMLCMTQYRRQHNEEAVASCRRALEIEPALSLPHLILGKAYTQQGKYKEAETELLADVHLEPAGWEGPFELARCYYKMGDVPKALEFGRRAHDAANAPSAMHLLMVDLYVQTNDRQSALHELEAFAKQDPNSPLMPQVRKRMADLKK